MPPAAIPLPLVLAGFEGDERRVQLLDGRHEGGAGEREVTHVRPVGTLAVIDALDDFGDQAVHVQVPWPWPWVRRFIGTSSM